MQFLQAHSWKQSDVSLIRIAMSAPLILISSPINVMSPFPFATTITTATIIITLEAPDLGEAIEVAKA